ncbi:MAG: hypothetical protein ACI8QD_002189 [Cyclobacteriaceae bacterium]|jgi:hypothetical protein
MNLKNLTLTAFVTIVSALFFSSCQPETDRIEYQIKGNLVTTVESQDSLISIKQSIYEKSGDFSVPYSKLKNQALVSNLATKDASSATKISNGIDTLKYYSIITSEIIFDSFTVLKQSEHFLISGKVESEIEIVKNSRDTIKQIVKSTFTDTIYITNCKKDYAEKASFYVMNTESIKHHQEEINALSKELTTKTASR